MTYSPCLNPEQSMFRMPLAFPRADLYVIPAESERVALKSESVWLLIVMLVPFTTIE